MLAVRDDCGRRAKEQGTGDGSPGNPQRRDVGTAGPVRNVCQTLRRYSVHIARVVGLVNVEHG